MTEAQKRLYACLLDMGHVDAASKIRERKPSGILNENNFNPRVSETNTAKKILLSAFVWENTLEGHDYWQTVYRELPC